MSFNTGHAPHNQHPRVVESPGQDPSEQTQNLEAVLYGNEQGNSVGNSMGPPPSWVHEDWKAEGKGNDVAGKYGEEDTGTNVFKGQRCEIGAHIEQLGGAGRWVEDQDDSLLEPQSPYPRSFGSSAYQDDESN